MEIKPGGTLTPNQVDEVVSLCSQAFGEPYGPYLQFFQNSSHILGRFNGLLVSHALWITRWLQVNGSPFMKTAYVEAVATDKAHRRKGYASAVLTFLMDNIQEYDIGCLSPAETTLYERLGWEYWLGSLYARKEEQMLLVPDETVMIFRTAKTPNLDLHAPLSIEWREGEVW